jgi:hypothetical protein
MIDLWVLVSRNNKTIVSHIAIRHAALAQALYITKENIACLSIQASE